MAVGAVILAGGKSSRMNGRNKALLHLKGQSFLEKILRELSGFQEVLISADRMERYPQYQGMVVPDLFPGTGPIGGLYSSLSACKSDALLVVSCDMPLFSAQLGEYLLSYHASQWDALVLEDRSGRLQPLCGIYQKSSLPVLLEQLQSGNYKMLDLLARLRVKTVKLRYSAFPDTCVWNINSPEDYARLLRTQRAPAVIAISGVKNSGKTTLLEKLIPLLRDMGCRVAAVKHDGHDFDPDTPGTDSYRFRRAGAVGTAVFSGSQGLIVDQTAGLSMDHFIRYFHDADLILAEGLKNSPYPKIQVMRREVSQNLVCDPGTLLAVMSDAPFQAGPIPVFDLNDAAGAARLLARYMEESLFL